MLNVIIAEDNVPISVQLSNAINTENVRCIAILNDGNDVYSKIKVINPDMLILELNMPNAVKILDEIAKDEQIKTKVVIYSEETGHLPFTKEYECICKFISKITPYEEIRRQIQEIANRNRK